MSYTPEEIAGLCDQAERDGENGWMSTGEMCMVALVTSNQKFAPDNYNVLECVDRLEPENLKAAIRAMIDRGRRPWVQP